MTDLQKMEFNPDPGISTQIFYYEPLAESHLAQARDAGFERVEIWGMEPHFDVSDPIRVRAASAALKNAGIRLHSLHASYYEPRTIGKKGAFVSIAHTDPAQRRDSVAKTLAALDALEALGGRYLVVHFAGTGDRSKPESLAAVVASMLELSDAIHGRPLEIAFENVGGGLASAQKIIQLLEEYDFEQMGVCLDIGHAQLWEDPREALLAVAGRLLTVHIHDNNGLADEHLVPFQGVIDWATVAATFHEIGYNGAFILEPKPRPSLTQPVEKSMSAFRQILGEEPVAPKEAAPLAR